MNQWWTTWWSKVLNVTNPSPICVLKVLNVTNIWSKVLNVINPWPIFELFTVQVQEESFWNCRLPRQNGSQTGAILFSQNICGAKYWSIFVEQNICGAKYLWRKIAFAKQCWRKSFSGEYPLSFWWCSVTVFHFNFPLWGNISLVLVAAQSLGKENSCTFSYL